MNVESRLAELIGPAAGRLHTGRSRNDQVATDFRLWLRQAIDEIDVALTAYQRALARKSLDHAATVMSGLTHLQPAQPTVTSCSRLYRPAPSLQCICRGSPRKS